MKELTLPIVSFLSLLEQILSEKKHMKVLKIKYLGTNEITLLRVKQDLKKTKMHQVMILDFIAKTSRYLLLMIDFLLNVHTCKRKRNT